MSREGEAKVADVGLSQVLQNTYLSRFDGMGTFAYAAPELLSGGSNCSTKADIWRYGHIDPHLNLVKHNQIQAHHFSAEAERPRLWQCIYLKDAT